MSSNERKDKPLVSVAIITYNQKDYLRECIESCLEQDYPNFEVVVADDCSTDGTQEMLREYDTKYPGKFVLKLAEKNQGITPNSNVAHFACSGKYIAWMGGDDLMLPGKISNQVEFMESNPDCTISYHDLDVFQSETNKSLYLFSVKNRPREGKVDISIKYGVFNGACSSMVRKDKTPRNGFNQFIPVASDWLYWVESLNNGGEIKYINKVLGKYRRHSNNVTNKGMLIGQNVVDHLNTCGFILKSNPGMLKNINYVYSSILKSNRHCLPYSTVLLGRLRVSFDLQCIVALVVYYISLGKVRL